MNHRLDVLRWVLIAGLTGGALGCGEGSESNDPADELPPPAIMRDLVELDPGIGLESGAGDPIAVGESKIVQGVDDSGHPSAGMLQAGFSACSATLIGRKTVLTARHCVSGWTVSFKVGGQSYTAARIVSHPGFGLSSDLALAILGKEVSGVQPAPLNVDAVKVGQDITLVGFGKTGELSGSFGTKRMGHNRISSVTGTSFSYSGASNVCNGDSGGPTYVVVGGEERIAGVHSTKSGFCGMGGTDIRVDAFKSWILQNAGGDVSAPSDAQPNPDPPLPQPQPQPQPDPESAAAREGESCASRSCAAGLACSTVYKQFLFLRIPVGQFCMERCNNPDGADPACDGGERCIRSESAGTVCCNPDNPANGFTDPEGAGQGISPPPPSSSPVPPIDAIGLEKRVFELVNRDRAAQGLSVLVYDAEAAAVARAHSEDMCRRGYFSHTNPEGKSPFDRLRAAGLSFSGGGENIAAGQPSPEAVHTSWMWSPGHRMNILGWFWKRMGVGYARCGGRPRWTEVFLN